MGRKKKVVKEEIVEKISLLKKVYNSVKTFLQCGDKHAGADYLYLFDGEAWFYTDTYTPRNKRSFEEVEMNLETV